MRFVAKFGVVFQPASKRVAMAESENGLFVSCLAGSQNSAGSSEKLGPIMTLLESAQLQDSAVTRV